MYVCNVCVYIYIYMYPLRPARLKFPAGLKAVCAGLGLKRIGGSREELLERIEDWPGLWLWGGLSLKVGLDVELNRLLFYSG